MHVLIRVRARDSIPHPKTSQLTLVCCLRQMYIKLILDELVGCLQLPRESGSRGGSATPKRTFFQPQPDAPGEKGCCAFLDRLPFEKNLYWKMHFSLSPDGILMSASTAPHWGGLRRSLKNIKTLETLLLSTALTVFGHSFQAIPFYQKLCNGSTPKKCS